MNILLTHLHLDYPAGSETYTFTLVGALLRDHHQVQVVSPIRGLMAEHIHGLGARMLDAFEAVEGIPDVLHCQHNIMAMAARIRFPETPMVYHSHGTLPLPEQPPSVDLNIQRVVAVSHLVESHLVDRGVSPEAIRVLENPVDVRRFSPRGAISDSPRRALVLSNKMDPGTLGVIEAACRRLGIALEVLGLNGSLWEVEEHLNRADMVFSLGRGAIEAMACGRAVYATIDSARMAGSPRDPSTRSLHAPSRGSGTVDGSRRASSSVSSSGMTPAWGRRIVASLRTDTTSTAIFPVSWASTARPVRRFDPVRYRSPVRRSKWR